MIENRKMVSKQKISATGTAAFDAKRYGERKARTHIADIAVAARQAREPSLTRAMSICRSALPAEQRQREREPSVESVVAITNGGLLSCSRTASWP